MIKLNREDFEILKNNIIYFDNGATTLKPNAVSLAIMDYYNNYRGQWNLKKMTPVEYRNHLQMVA